MSSGGAVGRITSVDFDADGQQIMTVELRIALGETIRQTLATAYGSDSGAWTGRDIVINGTPVADAAPKLAIGFVR